MRGGNNAQDNQTTAAAPVVAQYGEVDQDKLLLRNGDAGEPPLSLLLGKRARSHPPEPVLSPVLFEEVGMVSGLFLVPCLNLDVQPATFELCVAGSSD